MRERRVVIYGNAGSGKTTMARRLGLPLLSLDAIAWTDVMQFFVLVGGLIAILTSTVLSFHGDVGQVWSLAAAGGHITPTFFRQKAEP